MTTIFLSTSLVIAISAGAYFGYGVWQKKRSDALAAQLVKDFRGRESFEKMREAVDSGQVTRDQMRAARDEEREREERERTDAYFALPADQRDAYLDKIIDEFQERMKRWQNDGPQTRPTSRPAREEGEPTTRPQRTPEERAQQQQQRMDSQAPADRAKRAEFRAAMMKRMQDRGINMGRGGFGGGRGGGGGRGR